LLSENENAGKWIWEATRPLHQPGLYVPAATSHWNAIITCGSDIREIESVVGFCFPNEFTVDAVTGILTFQYNGTAGQPLFINQGRPNSFNPAATVLPDRTEAARPSSGHPGGVVAAFADRSTRFLNEGMNRRVFIELAQPGSGALFNPRDLD